MKLIILFFSLLESKGSIERIIVSLLESKGSFECIIVILKFVFIPLLQVILSPDADPPVVRIMDYKYDMLYAVREIV